MDASHRQYLEQRYGASEWHGRRAARRRLITDFSFSGSELSGWTLHNSRREEHATPPAIRTLWRRGDPAVELLSIDIWVCDSVSAAHDQLLEVLANIQSDAVERRDGLGDVAFALGNTMALFGRANVVVLIRNGGPTTVDVDPIARVIDELLVEPSKR
jgi:hypothetical protein